MLALRLARGSHPLVLLRRLAVAVAAAGTGFLLLSTVGHAAGHPSAADESLVRLLWCTAPLAATAQFAVSTARTDPAARLQRGMTAAGLGPLRLTLLATVSTTLTCLLGVFLALLVFLRLRGDLGGPFAAGFDADLLGAGHPVPLVGALMLLAIVPLTAAAATAVALRPRHEAGAAETGRGPPQDRPALRSPVGYRPGSGRPGDRGVHQPRHRRPRRTAAAPRPADRQPARCAGRLGAVGLRPRAGRTRSGASLRPAPLRRPARRAAPAVRAGAPGGVAPPRPPAGGPVRGRLRRVRRHEGVRGLARPSVRSAHRLGAAVVLACVTASALTAAVESRSARAHTTAALRRLGASASVLHRAAALRALALVIVLAPLTWTVAEMATLPLVH